MTADKIIAADRAIAAFYRMASEVRDLSLAEAGEELILALFAWNARYGDKTKEELLTNVTERLARGEEQAEHEHLHPRPMYDFVRSNAGWIADETT